MTCVAVLAISGCARKSTKVERLALVPANLLISDPSLEWLKAGVPVVVQHDLMTAHSLLAGFATDEGGAIQAGATQMLRTSIENRNGGFHVEGSIVDGATRKVVRVESADAASASVLLPALNTLAKKLDPSAIEFPTKSQAAWQAFSSARASSNPQQRAQFLMQALSNDQNFGAASVALLDMIVPNRLNDFKSFIEDAKAHRGGFAPYDRAKFDVAMNRLSNAPPAEQIKAAQQALAIAPNDLEVLTAMGRYQILEGDAAGGEQSLRRASALNPANTGLRVDLARGLLQLRKFKEAETVFSSINNLPSVYPELATCVLLEGDKARADGIVEKFIGSVQNEEIKPLLRASWKVISGDRQKGIDLVLSAKFNTPNIRAMAFSEANIWQLMGGDFANSEKTVGMLHEDAQQEVGLPLIAGLLADRASPSEEWEKKVQASALPDTVKEPVLAYGFFLRGNYEDSARVWQRAVDANHGVDLHARAMLASALDRAGKKEQAKKIAVMPFTPEFADLYSAISFTEMRRMFGK